MISADLVALKQRVVEAEAECQFWLSTNISGQTTERLVEIDLRYRQAARKLGEARAAYEKALEATDD